MIDLRTKSVDDTQALAGELAGFARPGDIVLLVGDLGTGKTAFAQGFGAGLGVTETITSPTFVLVRGYAGRLPLLHVDAYRIDHLQEVEELGLPELLDDGAVAIIEWGDVVAPALAADFLEVRLERAGGDDERLVRVRPVGAGWAPRAAALRRATGRWSAT